MDENILLHEIFRCINEMLWEYVESPLGSNAKKDEGTAVERRAARIGRESERLQKIIAAYFEQQTAMLQKLITDVRFSRFPLPKQRIGPLKRISIRRELWKAIRSLPFDERQDS